MERGRWRSTSAGDDRLNLWFMSRKPFVQYTVPMVALLNAKRLHDRMQMALGDTRIEDLWISTFAVGTIIYELDSSDCPRPFSG